MCVVLVKFVTSTHLINWEVWKLESRFAELARVLSKLWVLLDMKLFGCRKPALSLLNFGGFLDQEISRHLSREEEGGT